jgi:hypothetical protein
MTNQAIALRDEMSLNELGNVLVKSGFFADTRDAAQAMVKILAGRELGFGAIASMTGVYIVKGRVSLSANLMAAAVKRTSKYNYRIVEHTAQACELSFFEGKEEVGRSRFTAEDARKAGTQNMDKFPRNMLFARAMSNGAKWYCADVFGGPVYTPDELGEKVDEDGAVIEAVATPAPTNGNGHAEPVYTDKQIGRAFDAPRPAAQAAEAVAEAPAAVAEEAPKFATINGLTHIREWQAASKQLAEKYPRYQTVLKGGAPGGQPNFHHILGAAVKCGYNEVNDGNYELVIEAVGKRAATLAE